MCEIIQSLRAILDHLNRLLTVYSSRLNENDNMNNAAYPITPAATDIGLGQGFFEVSPTHGLQGRPKLQISRQQIEMLEEFGYTYAQSACILGVTAQTLRNRRRELNMPVGVGCYTEMSDLALDEVVHEVLQCWGKVDDWVFKVTRTSHSKMANKRINITGRSYWESMQKKTNYLQTTV